MIAKEFWERCEACRGYGCAQCDGGRVRPVADDPLPKPKRRSRELDQDGDDD